MKFRIVLLILAAALIQCPALLQAEEAASPAEPKSLISNGDFQKAGTDPAWPADWEQDKEAPITWEKDGDVRFLRLVATQPEMTIQQTRTIDLPESTKGVDLGIRFRVDNFKFGTNGSGGPVFSKDMHFNYQFLDAEGNRVPKSGGGFVLDSHAREWTDVNRRAMVPDGAKKLKVIVVLNKLTSGTLDVAQVTVNEAPAAEITAIKDAQAAAAKKAVDDEAAIPGLLALPSKTEPLKVDGNRLVTPDGKQVLLQGVNVPSLEWSEKGERILLSIKVAIDDWKANVVRLPVHDDFWFGRGKGAKAKPNDAEAYRKVVDDAVKLAAARGAYLILDLHRYHAAPESAVDFWKDAAARYKDNPAVLFDIYNEPTNISWEIWRNGGDVIVKGKGGAPDTSFKSPGMQGLVDAIRSTGAKNIIIAGGINYAYDLTGVLNGFALDDKGGNGLMYATHFYNWHRDWENRFLKVAEKYPVLVGEFGADVKKMGFIPAKNQEDPSTWVPDALAMVQKYNLNWTAFSLHPKATPVLISDWDYTPTSFWGVYVKDALAGKKFDLGKLR